MASEYVTIIGDNCYIETPDYYNAFGDCAKNHRQWVMSKEVFQKCYEAWILEGEDNGTDN